MHKLIVDRAANVRIIGIQITLRDRGSLLFLLGERREEFLSPRRNSKEPLSRRVHTDLSALQYKMASH